MGEEDVGPTKTTANHGGPLHFIPSTDSFITWAYSKTTVLLSVCVLVQCTVHGDMSLCTPSPINRPIKKVLKA